MKRIYAHKDDTDQGALIDIQTSWFLKFYCIHYKDPGDLQPGKQVIPMPTIPTETLSYSKNQGQQDFCFKT